MLTESNYMVFNRCMKLLKETNYLGHIICTYNKNVCYFMTYEQKCKGKICIGFLLRSHYRNLGVKFNTSILLHSYWIYVVQFYDINDAEYYKRLFENMKFWITKNACMTLDYGFEFICLEVFYDESDKVVSYSGQA